MNPKIIEEKPISVYDLKKEMKKLSKRDTELGIRSGKTEEYINSFVDLKDKEAEEIETEITKINVPRLKDLHIKKILDLLPMSVEELKVVLQGYSLTISKENMQKIVSVIEKVTSDKKA